MSLATPTHAAVMGGKSRKWASCYWCSTRSPTWTPRLVTHLPVSISASLVGIAGMAVELFIAAIALKIWAEGADGITTRIAYNVAFAASVGALLFNLNPLLRFDGYHISVRFNGDSQLTGPLKNADDLAGE